MSTPSAAAAVEPIRRALAGRLLLDFAIEDTESAKTLDTVARIADAAIAAGVRRDDAFVAVGGGVVTDTVGFAAAVLLRGVAWNAVPTTTAGMADAAIGGKTGVNHRLGKNLLGAYHAPAAILVDPAAAATLPDRDYRAGLVEAYKDAWIGDAPLAERAARRLPEILAREEAPLLDLLAGSVRVKAEIVTSDPKDSGGAGCSTSGTRSATRSRPPETSAGCGTGKRWRGASRPRSRSPARAPGLPRIRCGRGARGARRPRPVSGSRARRGAAGALPRARQRSRRRGASPPSCWRKSGERWSTRPSPPEEWLAAAAIMSLS